MAVPEFVKVLQTWINCQTISSIVCKCRSCNRCVSASCRLIGKGVARPDNEVSGLLHLSVPTQAYFQFFDLRRFPVNSSVKTNAVLCFPLAVSIIGKSISTHVKSDALELLAECHISLMLHRVFIPPLQGCTSWIVVNSCLITCRKRRFGTWFAFD